MGYHEKDWEEKAQVMKPIFYKRYVNDIFAVFESELDAETFHIYFIHFVHFIHTKRKSIKFTYEKQIENKLPFLDILRSNNKTLQTLVFHKKTYTGLLLNNFIFVPDSYKYGLIKTLIDVCIGLIVLRQVTHKKTYTGLLPNYFSFVPDSYKYGLIKTSIDRMYRINSNSTSFNVDLKNLKQVLLKNQYPLRMINNVIKKYLQNAITEMKTGSMQVELPNIETKYFKLPFIGMYSKVTQNKIEKQCKS